MAFYSVILLLAIILILYTFLIAKFISGWKRLPDVEKQAEIVPLFVSVVVSCKNERNNLPQLLESIQQQSYQNFDLIVVDDHSDDGTWEFLKNQESLFPKLKSIKNIENGKKRAIQTAIYHTSNELIVTLDADVTIHKNWLLSIVQFYQEKSSDIIVCPVKIAVENSFLHHFQQMEFASLVGIGAGAIGINRPILCNGANLAFRRESWLKSEEELHFETLSGDDIFLLQSVKKRGGKISFLKIKEAIALTKPKDTVAAFLHQRNRWASKFAIYQDKDLLLTGIAVFMLSLSLVAMFFAGFFKFFSFAVFLTMFTIKMVVDFLFFNTIKDFFDLQFSFARFLLFSFLYPFYIVVTVFSSIFGRRKEVW